MSSKVFMCRRSRVGGCLYNSRTGVVKFAFRCGCLDLLPAQAKKQSNILGLWICLKLVYT